MPGGLTRMWSRRWLIVTAVDEQSSDAATLRVAGAWFIVAGLLAGLVAASNPHLGYLCVAGLLVLVGVGLRIEAAIRDIGARVRRPASAGTNSRS
jgi:hypothetical protein